MVALERELAVYQEHLLELLPSEGRYVVIRGDDIAGIYESLDDALTAGYEKFGDADFLTKKITRIEPIHYFSRDIR